MKRTLLICGRYPLPEDHGSPIRTMNFVRFFRRRGRVDIAYSEISSAPKVEYPVFSNEVFLRRKEFGRSYVERFLRLINLRNNPLPVFDFCRDSRRSLRSLIEANDYDYILVRYLHNSSILFDLPKKYQLRAIVDFDDVLSGALYDSMFDSVKGLHKKAIVRVNRRLLAGYEKKCLGFGASLFCSTKDRAGVVNNGQKANVFVIPNIYENRSFDDYVFDDGFERGNILLFVGALGYGPNVRGLKWFIEEIFPEFAEKYSDARFLVVGRSPGSEVKKMCRTEKGIILLPDVPDVKEYYKRCRAVVVPLLAGGGTRIKILEAALANRPVLSTPLGAEGLDLAGGKDILLFANAGEFSAQYGKLLAKDTYHSLVNHARQIVSNGYTVREFDRAMETVVKWIEGGNQPRSVPESMRDVNDCITR